MCLPTGNEPIVLVNFFFPKWLDNVSAGLDPRITIEHIPEFDHDEANLEHGSVSGLSARYAALIQERAPQGRYLLLGYSFAAYFSFEVAVQLQRLNQQVLGVVMIDKPTPDLLYSGATATLDRIFRRFGAARTMRPRQAAAFIAGRARSALRSLFGLAVYRITRAMDRPVPAAVRHLENYHRLLQGEYRPGAFDGNVLLFRATNRRLTRPDPLGDLGWSEHVRGRLHTVDIESNHQSIIRRANAAVLVRHINAFATSHGTA